MVTTYNRKDLVKFGHYLLSKEREDRLRNSDISIKYSERKRIVTHADVENWIHKSKIGFINVDHFEMVACNPEDVVYNFFDEELSLDFKVYISKSDSNGCSTDRIEFDYGGGSSCSSPIKSDFEFRSQVIEYFNEKQSKYFSIERIK